MKSIYNDAMMNIIKELDTEFSDLPMEESASFITNIPESDIFASKYIYTLPVFRNFYTISIISLKGVLYLNNKTQDSVKTIIENVINKSPKYFVEKDESGNTLIKNFYKEIVYPWVENILDRCKVTISTISLADTFNMYLLKKDMKKNTNCLESNVISAINIHGVSTEIMQKVDLIKDRNKAIFMIVNNFFKFLSTKTNVVKEEVDKDTKKKYYVFNTKLLFTIMVYLEEFMENEYNRIKDIDTGFKISDYEMKNKINNNK